MSQGAPITAFTCNGLPVEQVTPFKYLGLHFYKSRLMIFISEWSVACLPLRRAVCHRVGGFASTSLLVASNPALLEQHSGLACGQLFPHCLAGQVV